MIAPDREEWEAVAQQFGVDLGQVRRDHLISHVLAAVSAGLTTDDVVFYGGTALSRTYLTDARLSEDIDLIALAPRSHVAELLEAAVRRGLARSHGRPSWKPALTATRGSQPAILAVDGPVTIQVQLVSTVGCDWPTEIVDLGQRFSDAPPARLRTLTSAGFAAAKLSAWLDRRAARDLYDLWALARRGLIDDAARAVFVRKGPTGRPPTALAFDEPLDEATWRRALSHQTRLGITAAHALDTVRRAWLMLPDNGS